MIEQPPLCIRIEAWTREAVETWGDDWALVCAHIEQRMRALAPEDKGVLAAEAALTLVGSHEGARH